MDLYLEYESYKTKLHKAQKNYDKILCRKEELFRMTQPSPPNMEGERVTGGEAGNSFDTYLILKEKEKIDERLEEAKSILDGRKLLLETKREELKTSNNPYDKVYYYRFIEKWKVKQISKKMAYSEPQVYRMQKSIRERINEQRRITAANIINNNELEKHLKEA